MMHKPKFMCLVCEGSMDHPDDICEDCMDDFENDFSDVVIPFDDDDDSDEIELRCGYCNATLTGIFDDCQNCEADGLG